MTILADLPKPRGVGKRKLAGVTASITGTGALTTGLSTIDYAVASMVNAATTVPTQTAEVTSISGGTVNVVVIDHTVTATAEHAVSSAAKNVTAIAIGY